MDAIIVEETSLDFLMPDTRIDVDAFHSGEIRRSIEGMEPLTIKKSMPIISITKFSGASDSSSDEEEKIKRISRLPTKKNLIKWNSFTGAPSPNQEHSERASTDASIMPRRMSRLNSISIARNATVSSRASVAIQSQKVVELIETVPEDEDSDDLLPSSEGLNRKIEMKWTARDPFAPDTSPTFQSADPLPKSPQLSVPTRKNSFKNEFMNRRGRNKSIAVSFISMDGKLDEGLNGKTILVIEIIKSRASDLILLVKNLYNKNVTYKIESLLMLLTLTPFLLLISALLLLNITILQNYTMALSYKLVLTLLGLFGVEAVFRLNKRHSYLSCMKNVREGTATAKDLFETSEGKAGNHLLDYGGIPHLTSSHALLRMLDCC